MRKYLIRYCLFFLAFFSFKVKAQDPQFSQNYAVPNLFSPAFVGLEGRSKVNFIHRNQWPNLSSNYVFSGLSVDLALDDYQSGVGLILTNDAQFSNLQTNTAGLQYAYHVKLNDYSSLSLGISGTYMTRKINSNGLIFYDQIKDSYLGNPISPSDLNIMGVHNFDLGTGALFTSEVTWIGFSVQHLNRPDFNLRIKPNATDADPKYIDNRINPKYSFQIGMKIPLDYNLYEKGSYKALNNEKSISPVVHFKRQGEFTQLDIGTYYTNAPLILGAWYRGIPIQKLNPTKNRLESLVLLAGYRKNNISVGYSYDLTLSSLGPSTGGAHELTIAYLFDFDFTPSKKGKMMRMLRKSVSCPHF